MREFKDLVPYESAVELMLGHIIEVLGEDVPLEQSLGRVLDKDVASPIDSPPFNRSAMDGYALRAEETFEVAESSPAQFVVVDDIAAGEHSDRALNKGEAIGVMTGTMMPKGADAVVMQEHVERTNDDLFVKVKLPPNKNVSLQGEDTRKGDTVAVAGTRIGPAHIALMRSLGLTHVEVRSRPRVSVIVTGDELVPAGGELGVGKIYESNSIMLRSLLERTGCDATFVSLAKDEPADIRRSMDEARKKSDILLITGGSSFGKKDVAQTLVGDFVFHGVTIKPGRPFGFAIMDGFPIFVLSGYPVASFAQYYLFVIPYLELTLGTRLLNRVLVPVSGDMPSSLGRREFVRCRIRGGKAEPIRLSGSGMLASISAADGFFLVEENVEGVNNGDIVEFTYFV